MIILQVGVFAFKDADSDPQKVVDRLREYGDSIDYALLDTSMGKGKGLDSELLLTQLRLISAELPALGLAVAGGLGPDTMELLKPIAAEFPAIAIDAQGSLKDKDAPRDALGHLIATTPPDSGRTQKYIREACAILDKAA
jgi:3-keto-L-gulonate-6-phosphate decarboxylase